MAAIFAILAQQWVRQYVNIAFITNSERARIRQKRFEAFDNWFVPQMIMGLALLLQAALFLFFSGLVLLLWTLNVTVAIAITLAASVFVTEFLLTTVIPAFCTDYPYRSPLAWGFNQFCCSITRLIASLILCKLFSRSLVKNTGKALLIYGAQRDVSYI